MQKVIVIGCPGAGKSTFSKKLHQLTTLPLFHLDLLYWNSDRTTVSKAVFIERLNNVLKLDRWIIDGNYGSTIELRMKECDTVFFLDLPVEVCLDGVKQRQGKARSDMPWTETEDDDEFLEFIRSYNTESRPEVTELLKRYGDKESIVFRSRQDVEYYLKDLRKNHA